MARPLSETTYHGDQTLLQGALCVLLNSRQSKRPCHGDLWVRQTVRAVEHLVQRNYVFVTSVGLNTWELSLHLVNVLGGRQVVLLNRQSESEITEVVKRVVADFQLERDRCGFIVFDADSDNRSKRKEGWQLRDDYAVELASVIVPVSIRPGGNLAALLERAETSGKTLINDFRCDYLPGSDQIKYGFDLTKANPRFDEADWNYVIHWTRSSHDPFPGETSHDYYRDLLTHETYPRSAYHALSRMASLKQIFGSDRFIRGGHRVVSFSELNPVKAISLMRWRRRYVYYNFEPYGIAIDRESAIESGIRPVIYGDDSTYASLTQAAQPYFQNIGQQPADWRPEAEWRHLGDFDLSKLPSKKVKLITFTEEEAKNLRLRTSFEIVPLML